MNDEELGHLGFGRLADATRGVAGRRGGDNQTAVVYDLLSEGDIEGLKNGPASIYFNGTPIIDPNSDAYKSLKNRRGTCTTTADSTTVTVSSGLAVNEIDLTDGVRIIQIMGAGDTLTGNGTNAGVTTTKNNPIINTTASFFDSTDATTTNDGLGNVYIRIPGAGYDGHDYFGKIVVRNSATQAHVSPPVPTAVSYKTIVKDLVTTIESITNSTTIVIADAAETAVTGYKCIISPPKKDNTERLTEEGFNFEHVSAFFRTGRQHQPAPKSFAGQVGTTYAKSFSQEIKQTTNSDLGISSGQEVIIKTALADLDIVDPGEIDSLRVAIEFASLIRTSKNTANEYPARVEFQIWFEYYQGGTWKNTTTPVYGVTDEEIKSRQYDGHETSYSLANKVNYGLGEAGAFNSGVVNHKTKSKYIYEFPIDIEKYKPFSNFRIRIKRVTGNELLEHTKYQNNHQSRLNSIYAFVHDRQNFAHSAYAGVTFQASEFSSVPERAYECRGLRIQVPTNYLTREETGGDASYKRDTDDGTTESTDQAWDGKFRGDISDTTWRASPTHVNYGKVYCNNPAWVYYDIMTNNRYGLGEFLKAENIDKYALYAIARYCDELVPDGEGGTEPRFTCNLYLSTKKEAFKVLTEMASIFRGMLYWMDSKASLVMDRPKEPIYTFTRSNVLGGQFSYQSSSLRMRTNQVNVTWNDPTRFYKQYVEAVDDVDDIIDTGRVIPKNIIAMGCTSQGQANRMGRWTLLTEKLEPEVVTFKTGINAGFLKVGDLVYIQDKADSGVTASGRVSNTGTRNSTTIPLDRSVTLESGATYDLHLIYPKGGAYLNEDGPLYISDASTTKYQRGDLITSAKLASNTNTAVTIDTEEEAANIIQFGTPYTALKTYWSPYSRVETQTVSTSAGTVSSLTTSAFTGGAPNAEVMWALTNTTSPNTAKGARKFRVQSVAETEDLSYEIAAQFYDDQKFDSIDRGYGVYKRTYEPLPLKDERVPFVKNLSVRFEPIASTTLGSSAEEEITSLYNAVISWQAPYNATDNSLYEFLHSYDLLHNVTSTGNNSPVISIPPSVTTYTVPNVVPGNYKIAVRVRSTINQVGQWKEISQIFASTEKASGVTTLPKTGRLKHGGALTTTISIENTDQVTLGDADYVVTSPTGKVTTVSSGTTTYDFGTAGLQSGETGYLLWDDSATSWKMVEEYSDTTVLNAAGTAFSGGVNYWKEIATGSAGLTRVTAGNDALATVAITETRNSETISEVGTSISVGTIKTKLNDEFSQGDFIKLGTGTAAWYGTVKSLSSPHYFNPSATVSTSNDTINIPNNSFTTNQALYYQRDGNTLVAGLTDNTLYYVVDKDEVAETFKLSASSGGSAIDLTGTGSDANQYLQSATATITTNEPIYKAFDGSGADAYIYKLAFVPDFENDFLYAKVVNTSGSYAITVLGTQPGTQGAAGASGGSGLRGGSIFTFEEATNGNISAANVTNWTGTLNESNAEDVAGAVIAAATDNYIRTNDRITITDNSANKAGTRIFTGTSTATEGDVDHNDFSSLVVEQFDGSVIVDGTLLASKINTSSITIGTFTNDSGFTDDTAADAAQSTADSKTTASAAATAANSADKDAGSVGGWTIDSSSIYSGSKDLSGFTSNGAITLSSTGEIHTPTFYVESDGTSGFKGTVTIGGTDLTTTNTLNANTTAGNVGLGNVDNDSTATIRAVGAATSGTTGGWTIDSSSIYSGTKDTSGFTGTNGHITISSAGGIHTPKFYVDSSGNAGFKGTVTVGTTDLTSTNTLNTNTTSGDVGLGSVQNLNAQSQAQTGLIAGTTITGGGITLSSGGTIKGGQTAYNDGTGFFLGYTGSQYKFSIGNQTNRITWDGSTMTVRGTLQLAGGTAPTDDTAADAAQADADTGIANAATAQTEAESKTTAAAAASAANSAAKTAGSVGGLTLASDKMYIGTGTYGNANTPFYVDDGGDFSLKDKLTWDQSEGTLTIDGGGTFSGALSAASGTFAGALSGGTISIGSSNSIFKADSNGIYLGNATFGSAPFRVTPAGALTASNVTITGGSVGNSVTVGGTAASTVASGAATGTTVGGYFSSGILGRAAGGFGIDISSSTGVPYLNGGVNFEAQLAVGRGGTGASASTTWLNANVHSYAVQGGTNVTWKRFASGKVEPSSATYTFTIVWKDGAGNGVGSSPYTTVMRADFDSTNNDIDSFTTVSNDASATVGTIQGAGTTSAYIDVTSGNTTCRLTATYVSLTSFNFKFSS